MPRKLKCECGTCRTCKRRDYMRNYYRRPGVREANLERVRVYQHTPEGRANTIARAREWEGRNREKHLAQRKARDHLARGNLTRKPCEVCGEPAEMHHDDYSKPLDVRWFCRQHHKDVHARA